MLPAQRNKVDISKLNDQEQLLFAKYGKLPNHKGHVLKTQRERKYFDSGDYALSKAGVAPQSNVGTAIPNPQNIPHASSPGPTSNGLSISPTNSVSKESGLASPTEKPESDDAPDVPAAAAEEPAPATTVVSAE
ncbi:hypothetical protein CYLTODRAFT_422248 [Cylindrobasidium torrendii FP15055 ss-10]|uniref:mRNA stability protein n=1 Tax=Cylindrobasidium torrendii FP15055 ss-10 TaxID=1314674 RepID=A0A0D7BC54_9AGAR|nr:hypothetical protein CYLTODRAFT_422248 [Cylindrobasidium torrendii FP15055 ss-10]